MVLLQEAQKGFGGFDCYQCTKRGPVTTACGPSIEKTFSSQLSFVNQDDLRRMTAAIGSGDAPSDADRAHYLSYLDSVSATALKPPGCSVDLPSCDRRECTKAGAVPDRPAPDAGSTISGPKEINLSPGR